MVIVSVDPGGKPLAEFADEGATGGNTALRKHRAKPGPFEGESLAPPEPARAAPSLAVEPQPDWPKLFNEFHLVVSRWQARPLPQIPNILRVPILVAAVHRHKFLGD